MFLPTHLEQFQILAQALVLVPIPVRLLALLLLRLLMEYEVGWQIGADRYERTAGRQTYRNGFREGIWETRVGEISLAIPKMRTGSLFPSLLEPRKRPEKALLAVVHRANIRG